MAIIYDADAHRVTYPEQGTGSTITQRDAEEFVGFEDVSETPLRFAVTTQFAVFGVVPLTVRVCS